MAALSDVKLGFVEEIEKHWLLLSHYFPSKVGGRPSWLSFKPLPCPSDQQCRHCKEISSFLCQVYAPVNDRENCFHRTIYVFVCRNVECSTEVKGPSFIVLRSQLQRSNHFYPSDPPNEEHFDESAAYPQASEFSKLCFICGALGPQRCGRCKSAHYCSKNHQVLHWKNGHKKNCEAGLTAAKGEKPDVPGVLFPELDLVTEPEPQDDEVSEKDDATRIQEFEEVKASLDGKMMSGQKVDAELEQMAASLEDETFGAFKARIGREPAQVLRYERGGEPLWVATAPLPTDLDVPPCQLCRSPRIFEFQLMPQLLNHLGEATAGGLDWGTVAVYTCSGSCDAPGGAYVAEVAFTQHVSS